MTSSLVLLPASLESLFSCPSLALSSACTCLQGGGRHCLAVCRQANSGQGQGQVWRGRRREEKEEEKEEKEGGGGGESDHIVSMA